MTGLSDVSDPLPPASTAQRPAAPRRTRPWQLAQLSMNSFSALGDGALADRQALPVGADVDVPAADFRLGARARPMLNRCGAFASVLTSVLASVLASVFSPGPPANTARACRRRAAAAPAAMMSLGDLDILDLTVCLHMPGLDAIVVIDGVVAADLAQLGLRRLDIASVVLHPRLQQQRLAVPIELVVEGGSAPCRAPGRRSAPATSCGHHRARRRRA